MISHIHSQISSVRWSLEMDKQCHPTFYWAYDYMPMLALEYSMFVRMTPDRRLFVFPDARMLEPQWGNGEYDDWNGLDED